MAESVRRNALATAVASASVLFGVCVAAIMHPTTMAEPPGCWGPAGVDSDCLGPGPYGHGQWGPEPGTMGPGPMIVPDPSGPAWAGPDTV